MGMTRAAKERIVGEVAELARGSSFAMALQYRGVNVAELTALRKEARAAGITLRVVRNSLAKRALADTGFSCMGDQLSGPVMLSFASDGPGEAARLVRDFARDHEQVQVRLIAWRGALLPVSDLGRLADLPSLAGARAMLLGLLQAPCARWLRLLAEPPSGVVRLLAARSGSVADSGVVDSGAADSAPGA